MAALVTPASVVSELMARGRESAAVLEALLQDASPSPPAHGGAPGAPQELAAEILRCWDRALAALHACVQGAAEVPPAGSEGRKRKPGAATAADTRPKRRARVSGRETPPARVEEKRTVEDGYIWRKYGQKEILNSSHPRLYFRCTYKHDSGCPATRQVQHSDHDPSLYVITYFGEHTCCVGGDATTSAEEDLLKTSSTPAPFVIDFRSGSGTASSGGGSPPWLSSDDDDGRSCDTPRSSNMTKHVESTSSDLQPAAEQSSSADDVSCSSPAWDPLPVCSSDWDYFGESSFDYITELINRYEIAMFQ